MKVEHARIILELVANIGYIDELLENRLSTVGEDQVRIFAHNMDDLIATCNSVLPLDEQTHLHRSIVDELELCL